MQAHSCLRSTFGPLSVRKSALEIAFKKSLKDPSFLRKYTLQASFNSTISDLTVIIMQNMCNCRHELDIHTFLILCLLHYSLTTQEDATPTIFQLQFFLISSTRGRKRETKGTFVYKN